MERKLSDLDPGDRRAPVAPASASWVSANLSPRKNLAHDVPAGLVVFLVALPLCLGIAMASGAPLFAGLITGIVAGLLVSWLSGSPLSVSGPAAGLTVIVLEGIGQLGFAPFLLAVTLAGVGQVLLGFVRAGVVAYYFPSTVIKGMLAAIGLILVLKQVPHAIGWDADYEGDMFFDQLDGRNTLTEIVTAFEHVHLGACAIALTGLAIMVGLSRRAGPPRWLPAPLAVVVVGVALNECFRAWWPELANEHELLVQIPTLRHGDPLAAFEHPSFAAISDPAVWRMAATLAVVASVETLLCIEAIDRLDPYRRRSDTDRELRAQGVGNIVCGLLGGLPMTSVIVRSSANVLAGGRTRTATFVHGLLLLGTVVAIPGVLNRIPLAALAAVLLHVGYRLAPLRLFRRMARLGFDQLVPFAITVVAILFTDLLVGVSIGMAAGVFFILRANAKTPFFMHRGGEAQPHPNGDARARVRIQLGENVTFLNKEGVNRVLHELPDGAVVVIDGSRARWIDRDVLEIIHDFAETAPLRGIDVVLTDVPAADAPAHELEERRPIVLDAVDAGERAG
jgi:MFS superfamily sulfate permease-like transporter